MSATEEGKSANPLAEKPKTNTQGKTSQPSSPSKKPQMEPHKSATSTEIGSQRGSSAVAAQVAEETLGPREGVCVDADEEGGVEEELKKAEGMVKEAEKAFSTTSPKSPFAQALGSLDGVGELESIEDCDDVKVAMIGNVDSGKSTLVGVLTKAVLDDGRGAARARVFNFAHEQQNGRTSSIAQEIMGFSPDGQQVLPDSNRVSSAQCRNATWSNIVSKSDKVVTFLDLCGHERYLKTTIFGLVGLCPDYAMIVIGANMGIQRMTREHLGIALALRVPVFIVVTKIDIAPENVFRQVMQQLCKLLKSPAAKKMPLVIREDADVEAAASSIASDRVCPIFCVSNVTGEGLPQLRSFLHAVSNRQEVSGLYRPATEPAEFHIDGVYQVTGVGMVVAGTMKAGTVENNTQMLLGPDKLGNFRPVLIRSIHSKRVPVNKVISGQAASFALRAIGKKDPLKRNTFRKGMVLVAKELQPKAVWEFEAEVVILHHATTIKERYQAVIHCGVVRQSAQVKLLTGDLLRTGDKGLIRFRFMYHPEYIALDLPLLFREGRTKGLGRITQVFHDTEE